MESNTAGFGAYHLDSLRADDQAVFVANPNYFLGQPYYTRVIYKEVPSEASRVTLLKTGQVQLIDRPSIQKALDLMKDPNVRVDTATGRSIASARMNPKCKPFDDVRVRQAINYGVDKTALNTAIFGGTADIAKSIVPPIVDGYTDAYFTYDYNPEKAKALLAEAGYPDGLTIDFLGPVGRYANDKELQEAMAGMFAEVGVQVNHIQPEWAEFIRQWTAELHPMHFVGTGNQVMDCDQHLGYRIHGPRYGRYYQSDEVDALIEAQLAEYDTEKRKAILAEIQQKVRDDAPWIFLFDLMDLYGMTARVDWQPRPDEMVWAY
jgi:ABC-type transport system substrate-binding protein